MNAGKGKEGGCFLERLDRKAAPLMSLLQQMESSRSTEVKLLGHGHTTSEIPESHRISVRRNLEVI